MVSHLNRGGIDYVTKFIMSDKVCSPIYLGGLGSNLIGKSELLIMPCWVNGFGIVHQRWIIY